MFILSNNAYEWFGTLIQKNPFTGAAMMDIYHLCFTIAANQVLKNSNTTFNNLDDPRPFIDSWPKDYKNNAMSIIALLLEAEITRQSYDREDKKMIKTVIGELIQADTSSRLSDRGFTLMNLYSYNGYLVIKKCLKEKPQEPTIFLQHYHKVLSDIVNS